MKSLAWDTSSRAGALVALEWDFDTCQSWQDVKVVADLSLNVDLTHSERLLWGIHQLLEAARWQLKEIDVFGVGVGPGSFTGLRIGVTTARTLSHTLGKPLVCVSSLVALARPAALNFSQKNFKNSTLIIATTDACKGELFALWGAAKDVMNCIIKFENNEIQNGIWKKGVEERVIAPSVLVDELLKKISKNTKYDRWVVMGEGRKRYLDEWQRLPRLKEGSDISPRKDQIQGVYLGQLVWESVRKGLLQKALLVQPRYLRASDAELKLKAGLLKPTPSWNLSE